MSHCPACGSERIARRGALFRSVMRNELPAATFDWYSLEHDGARPPKSLFLLGIVLFLVVSLPAVVLWSLGWYQLIPWLVAAGTVLVCALVLDILITHKRYRRWASGWVCDECRHTF